MIKKLIYKGIGFVNLELLNNIELDEVSYVIVYLNMLL